MDSLLLGSALEMLVLEVIAQGPSYGYEIAQTVAGRSDGTFEMKEGSLYPALASPGAAEALEVGLARGRRPAAEVLRADRRRPGRAGRAEAIVAAVRGRNQRRARNSSQAGVDLRS